VKAPPERGFFVVLLFVVVIWAATQTLTPARP
jgi:hypothetical protein